jgi:hypothetical protein
MGNPLLKRLGRYGIRRDPIRVISLTDAKVGSGAFDSIVQAIINAIEQSFSDSQRQQAAAQVTGVLLQTK